MTRLRSLQVLDLSHNCLEGSIHEDLHNLDRAKGVHSYLGFLLDQIIDPSFRGNTLTYTYILETNTHIDLSSNVFIGFVRNGLGVDWFEILFCVSNNNIYDNIPSNVGNLLQLEIIRFVLQQPKWSHSS